MRDAREAASTDELIATGVATNAKAFFCHRAASTNHAKTDAFPARRSDFTYKLLRDITVHGLSAALHVHDAVPLT